MPLAAGSRLGPYEIVSALGAGGMGEVYKAHDARRPRRQHRWDVSIHGAWSRDGRELFFRESTKVMAAAFHPAATPTVEQPVQLFDRPYRGFDVAPDGRFLMIPVIGPPPPAPGSIVVVQNWMEELKRLVPNR